MIIRGDGEYSTFCSILSTTWISDRFKDAYFLIMGSMCCAYVLQTPRPMRIKNEQNYTNIILEEKDISYKLNNKQIINFLLKFRKNKNPKVIFLLSTCTVEIQKIDINLLAKDISNKINLPVIPVKTSGFKPTYTSGEDEILSALIDYYCNTNENLQTENNNENQIIGIGSLNPDNLVSLKEEFKNFNINNVIFYPEEDLLNIPNFKNKKIFIINPYLVKSINKLVNYFNCEVINSSIPLGPYGTYDLFKKIFTSMNYNNFNKLDNYYSKILEESKKDIDYFKGKSVFIIGDNLLEIPISRFLLKMGVDLKGISTPFLNRKYLKSEIEAISDFSDDITIVEYPNNFELLELIEKIKPDIVFSTLEYVYPLKNMGLKVIWSVKPLFNSIYGFTKCKTLINMFSFENSFRE